MNFNKDELINVIDNGINGKAVWASTGFQRMEEDGLKIFPSCYTIIGGNPGTGKTAYFHDAFILNAYDIWVKEKKLGKTDIELYWIIYSMERPLIETKLKWIARKIFLDSINDNPTFPLLYDVQFLRGFKKTKVTNEIKERIYKTFDYFEEIMNYVDIHSGRNNPIGIKLDIDKYAATIGTVEKIPFKTKDGIEMYHKVYHKNNPKRITIIGIDHIGKLGGVTIEGKRLTSESRELMGLMSDIASQDMRDFYGFSPVLICQFNRGMENANRFGNETVIPQPSDFKNSSNMMEDSDIAIALFNPYKLGIKEFGGYNLNKLVTKNGANRSRFLTILKNSYGLDDKAYGMVFFGEVGTLKELPRLPQGSDQFINYNDLILNK